MRVFYKYRVEIILFLFIFVLYFILRLPNLTAQPIFVDEAIYIRWAQIMKAEPTLRFLPLSDGKTPLFMWAMIPFFKVFENPLFAGRFLSIISGMFTMFGLLFMGWKFFNKRIGFLAAFLYAITPYTVFFDRMALVDSMLAAFSVWSLNVVLLLVKFPRIDLAMLLGYLLGGGLLTKPPGFFSFLALPASFFIFDYSSSNREKRVVKFFGLLVIAIVIGFVIYNILRLGPGFTNLNSRNQDYVLSFENLLIRPWDPFIPHFNDLSEFAVKLLGVPFIMVFFIGVLLLFIQKKKGEVRLLLAILFWGLISLIAQMTLLKTFTARYVLFSLMPSFVFCGWVIDQISTRFLKKNLFRVLLIILMSVWPFYFNYFLLSNPPAAPLPKNERTGYFEGWTAGYGFEKIAGFLMRKGTDGVVIVGTEGSFGTLPDGLEIYLDKYSHMAREKNKIVVLGGTATISAQLRDAAREHPAYFVANKSRLKVRLEGVRLIDEYPKAVSPTGTQDAILFFEVLP